MLIQDLQSRVYAKELRKVLLIRINVLNIRTIIRNYIELYKKSEIREKFSIVEETKDPRLHSHFSDLVL